MIKDYADLTKTKARLEKWITDQEARLEIYKATLPAVKRWEGKKITKRIATDAKKAIEKLNPKHHVFYRADNWMFHISVFVNGDYNNRMEMLIGYNSHPTFSIEKFIEYNQCFALNEERNPKLRAARPLVSQWVKRFNELTKKLEELEEVAGEYGCEYLVDPEKDRREDL